MDDGSYQHGANHHHHGTVNGVPGAGRGRGVGGVLSLRLGSLHLLHLPRPAVVRARLPSTQSSTGKKTKNYSCIALNRSSPCHTRAHHASSVLTHSERRPQIFFPKRKQTSIQTIVSSNWQQKCLYFHHKSVKLDVLCRQNKIWTFGNLFQSKKLQICT